MSDSSDARPPLHHTLSRRERQVMDGLYEHGPSAVADVLAFMADPPGYSAVRALLATMESKGLVRHKREGTRYVYRPVAEPQHESRSALQHVVRTFFGGSATSVIATLLSDKDLLAADELEELTQLIDRVKKEGR